MHITTSLVATPILGVGLDVGCYCIPLSRAAFWLLVTVRMILLVALMRLFCTLLRWSYKALLESDLISDSHTLETCGRAAARSRLL